MVLRQMSVDLQTDGITCLMFNPGWCQTDMGGPMAPLKPQYGVKGVKSYKILSRHVSMVLKNILEKNRIFLLVDTHSLVLLCRPRL